MSLLEGIDLSPRPTAKQRALLAKRAARLDDQASAIIHSTAVLSSLADGLEHLRLRAGFAYRFEEPEEREASDRSLPPSAQRPSATRIQHSRGAALRLVLAAIAMQQAQHKRAGTRATNPLPIRPPRGQGRSNYGWTDLLASAPKQYHAGRNYLTKLDKQARQVHSALDRLAAANLVSFVGREGTSHEGFQLLDERGGADRPGAAPLVYVIPGSTDACFDLPAAFVRNGWIHVLEDSEITLLLMIACGIGRLPDEDEVAIPSNIRLLHYGIGRDSYSSAHLMLRRFGLLNVREVGRHWDGKVIAHGTEDGEMYVHRLRLLPEGFEQPALETVTEVVRAQLAR